MTAPLGLLAELTHRCPLRCPYCSNPVTLERLDQELATKEWARVFSEAAALGVLQVHLSGGEPASRRDLIEITRAANGAGLYTNLITSGIGLTRERLDGLKHAGLDHVQISIQDHEATGADRIAGYEGAYTRKRVMAEAVVALEFPLTVNAVIHRANIEHVGEILAFAAELGAQRVEIAHTQYYGWGLRNRGALMPTRAQVDRAIHTVEELRPHYAARMAIDMVVPDYYARRPKPCMGGWGQRSLNISPSGLVLPCHAAQTIPGLKFWSVRTHSLAGIWERSPAFMTFRGTGWMQEPCRSCAWRERDFGGCRCQALAIAGDAAATDPSCEFSPHHEEMRAMAEADATGPIIYTYRAFA